MRRRLWVGDDVAVTLGSRSVWWRRRRGLFGVAAAVLVVAGVGLMVYRWAPPGGWLPRVARADLEFAAMVVGLLVAAAGVVVAVLAWRAPRPRGPRVDVPRRMIVGKLPATAGFLQPRSEEAVLARAAAGGRTAVLTQVLSGMGGVGKTQLAAQLARRLYERGKVRVLVWVSATSRETIVDGYAQAAAALGLTHAGGGVGAVEAAARFHRWLQDTGRRWLVVLDDLAQPGGLGGWWPPANPAETVRYPCGHSVRQGPKSPLFRLAG